MILCGLATKDDVEHLEKVAADAQVLASFEMARDQVIDWDYLFAHGRFFKFPYGFAYARLLANGVADVHVCAMPKGRGMIAYRACLKVRQWLVGHGYKRLVASVHRDNAGGQMFVGALGFRRSGMDPEHILYEWFAGETR